MLQQLVDSTVTSVLLFGSPHSFSLALADSRATARHTGTNGDSSLFLQVAEVFERSLLRLSEADWRLIAQLLPGLAEVKAPGCGDHSYARG